MEKALKSIFYKSVYEHLQDAVFLTNLNGVIFKANKIACKMLMMSEEELVNTHRDHIIVKGDIRLNKALEEIQTKGHTVAYLDFKRKNGEIFKGHIYSTIFKDEKDRPWNITIVKDITKDVKTMNDLIKNTELLEYYAYYDYLTGALNRRGFIKKCWKLFQKQKYQKEVIVF